MVWGLNRQFLWGKSRGAWSCVGRSMVWGLNRHRVVDGQTIGSWCRQIDGLGAEPTKLTMPEPDDSTGVGRSMVWGLNRRLTEYVSESQTSSVGRSMVWGLNRRRLKIQRQRNLWTSVGRSMVWGLNRQIGGTLIRESMKCVGRSMVWGLNRQSSLEVIWEKELEAGIASAVTANYRQGRSSPQALVRSYV